ncbi:MAG: NB-ARC domain-containing protein [Cyanophyceae cyanobacterium]
MISQDFLKSLASERGVSDSELEALSLAIAGQSIPAIAKQLNIREDAVRKRLGEVYKKFQITGMGPGKLAKLQQLLISLARQNHLSEVASASKTEEDSNQARQDWGEAPPVSAFYGRSTELMELERSIVKGSRLVALLGIGGIGKTTLAIKLAQQIQSEFDWVIWRSLRRALPADELLSELVTLLSHQPTKLEDIDDRISQLIEHLRRQRCLLVLDDLEAVLSRGVAGYYREKYEDYGKLFQRLGEEPHQSCLMLVGLEKPKEVAFLERENLPVLSWQLAGLPEADARKILHSKGLAQEREWTTLIKLYRGHPLALKIVSGTIQEFFGGRVTDFLSYNTLVIGDIEDLLADQFERLSELEKDIMYCLAIAQEPVALPQLGEQMFLPVALANLLEALESLRQRSLIEKGQDSMITLQPAILEYVTNRLVEQVCEEIQAQKLDKIQLLRNHVLVQDKDGIKEASFIPILTRIQDKLRTIFRNEQLIESKLNDMQALLQEKSLLEVGYLPENVRHLLELAQN